MRTAEDCLNGITTLPPAPQVMPKLLAALSDPNSDLDGVAELIMLDPSLTASLLQTCNSAMFGASSPVANVPEAVCRVGLSQVFRLVGVMSCSKVLKPSCKGWGVDPAVLWQHAVMSALAAQFCARDSGEDEGLAFTAGMLHDLGKIVLAESFKEKYAAFLSGLGTGAAFPAEAEKQTFGINHCEMGRFLLARWKFPTPIIEIVGGHHTPAFLSQYQRLTACVTLGNVVAHKLAKTEEAAAFASEAASALEALEFQPQRLDNYAEETQENFSFIQALFGRA